MIRSVHIYKRRSDMKTKAQRQADSRADTTNEKIGMNEAVDWIAEQVRTYRDCSAKMDELQDESDKALEARDLNRRSIVRGWMRVIRDRMEMLIERETRQIGDK